MENQAELLSAFYEFQQKVQNPSKNTEGYGYKYATLDSVIQCVKEAMEGTGLSFNQEVTSDGDRVGVTTNIFHKSGEMLKFGPFYIDKVQAKQMNNAQGAGAAITYARRYSLSATAGIASEEDTDASSGRGNSKQSYSSNSKSKRSKKQSKPDKRTIRMNELKSIVKDTGNEWSKQIQSEIGTVIKNYKKGAVQNLTEKEFEQAKKTIKASLKADNEVE